MTSEQRASEVLSDRSNDRMVKQFQLGDDLDTLLRLVMEQKDEAQDVARIEGTDNDDISRAGNLVAEDHRADTRCSQLHRCTLPVADVEIGLPNGLRYWPEVAFVVLQNMQVSKAPQSEIDDHLCTRSEPVDPELRIPWNHFSYNFLEDWGRGRGHSLLLGSGDRGFHIHVYARDKREFREHCADQGAFQLPPGYLVK
ncbi:MAG: hypothetical protein OXG37_16195 [Actinomycetia bacterium]|nr:hypothetical protein [Actinomycetes bacterium]